MSLSPNTSSNNEPVADPAITQAARSALDRYISVTGPWSFLRMLPTMMWEITRMSPATRTELKRLVAQYEAEHQATVETARKIVNEARSATPQNPDDVERVIGSWPQIDRPMMLVPRLNDPLHTALDAAIAKLTEVADSLRESAETIRAEHPAQRRDFGGCTCAQREWEARERGDISPQGRQCAGGMPGCGR